MEWLQEAWRTLVSSTPNWDLILRFLDVLIWPFVVLVGIMTVRPGRLIDSILERGGVIEAGGAAIRLGARINEVAEAVRTDEETATTIAPAANPLEESADPYTTIMNGWGLVIQGLEEAVERTHISKLDGRAPMDTVQTLRRDDWIGKKLAKTIQELWDVRNQVMRAGSNKLKRLGIDMRTAEHYYESASRIRTGIARAIAYREKKAASASIDLSTLEPAQAHEARPN